MICYAVAGDYRQRMRRKQWVPYNRLKLVEMLSALTAIWRDNYQRSKLTASTAAFVALALMSSAAVGTETNIWRIGEPDGSDHEFSGTVPRAGKELLVRIGSSTERAQWPRFHPGSGNGVWGGTPYRYGLSFELPQSPVTGVFHLDLDLLFRQPRVPALDLEINGHRGRYYFDPEPMFELGAVEDQFNPIRSRQRRRIALPATFFRPGENRLVLSAVDEPPTVISNQNIGGSGDSGFYYDALTLSHDPEGVAAASVLASVKPTIFFPRTLKSVREECYLMVQFPASWLGGRARVRIGDFQAELEVPKPAEFGEARLSFLVPADLPAARARIELFNADRLAPAPKRSTDGLMAGVPDYINECAFRPAKKWKLFYAPNEHLDVGYTDYRAKVAEVHARCMDELMKTLARHPKYRFNLDGSWIAEQWLELRSPAQTAQLAAQAKAGRIGMNAFYCSIATEYPSLEENIRNLYYSKELAARFGVPFDFALVSDVPSVSWCVPSVLASAGIHYFANGGNQDRGPMLANGHWNVRSPFWYEGPDGQRVLSWFSAHYHQFKALFGLPPALDSGRGGVERFIRAYELTGYVPDAVLIYGTEVENLPTTYPDAEFVERWNARLAWPQIVTCRFSEFFEYIEKRYGTDLPVVRGTGGAYWADNFGTLAGATARDRANQTRAVTAETFATLAAALDPKLKFSSDLDHGIWRELLLYSEHNFGIGGLNDRPESDAAIGIVNEKQDQTLRAEWDIDKLLRRSLSQLGDQIQTEGQNLLVFNPLGWRRSGLVQFQIDRSVTLTNLSTGEQVDCEPLAQKDGVQTIRFWAADVPPIGYKVYRLGHGNPAKALNLLNAPGNIVENRFYRLILEPERAAIKSMYDKQLGRELVDSSSPYLAGEYLFVSGGGTETGRGRGSEDSRLLHPFTWLPDPKLDIHHAQDGLLFAVENTPWGKKIRMRATALHTPQISTEILLLDDKKQIEFQSDIQVDLLLAKQASYFSFPWALSNMTFHYDIPNGFVNPARDLLEGGCNDWFSIQHMVNAEEDGASISLAAVDAPLVCLGDICRGRWLAQFTNSFSTVFSYALNNYWSPKWAGKKSGQYRYRYVITSGTSFQPAAAARWGREARVPLEVAALKTSDKLPGLRGRLPPDQASLATVMPENLVFTALKTAEDGEGLVARVLETGGQETDGVLSFPLLNVNAAQEANAVEVPGRRLKQDAQGIHFHIKPYQFVTVRLHTRKAGRHATERQVEFKR